MPTFCNDVCVFKYIYLPFVLRTPFSVGKKYLRRAKISVENSETRKRYDTCVNTKFLDHRHYLAVFTDFPLLSIIGLRPEIVYVLNWIVGAHQNASMRYFFK